MRAVPPKLRNSDFRLEAEEWREQRHGIGAVPPLGLWHDPTRVGTGFSGPGQPAGNRDMEFSVVEFGRTDWTRTDWYRCNLASPIPKHGGSTTIAAYLPAATAANRRELAIERKQSPNGPHAGPTFVKAPTLKITYAFCTYNRADRLPSLVAAMRAQACPVPFEILAVNNNSTDNTASVLERLELAPGPRLRVATEPEPGIVPARNRVLGFPASWLPFQKMPGRRLGRWPL